MMVTALGGGTISGTLGNAPVEDIGLKLGDAVTIQTGDVEDWLFSDGQSMTGGFSVSTLQNAAGKREQFTDGQSMTGGLSISTLKNAAGKRDWQMNAGSSGAGRTNHFQLSAAGLSFHAAGFPDRLASPGGRPASAIRFNRIGR